MSFLTVKGEVFVFVVRILHIILIIKFTLYCIILHLCNKMISCMKDFYFIKVCDFTILPLLQYDLLFYFWGY